MDKYPPSLNQNDDLVVAEITDKLFKDQRVSKAYHKVRPNYVNTNLTEKMMEFLAEAFEEPFDKAADVGCGTGLSTVILAPYFKDVIGMDPSATQIAEAQRMNNYNNVKFCVGKAEDLSKIPDQSLQLLTVGTAIHYFDCEVFFKEVERVLKPGGCFAQFGYINYYTEPKNLSFEENDHPRSREALRKCNELLVEIFTTFCKHQAYESCLDSDNAGVEPPYNDVHRQISCFSHPCTIESIMDYVESLGMWQSYCMETKCDADSLARGYRERFAKCLTEVTDEPSKFPIKWNMGLYITLARKPMEN